VKTNQNLRGGVRERSLSVDWIAHRGVSQCVAFVYIKKILIALGGGLVGDGCLLCYIIWSRPVDEIWVGIIFCVLISRPIYSGDAI
jgi:hypothetical protein